MLAAEAAAQRAAAERAAQARLRQLRAAAAAAAAAAASATRATDAPVVTTSGSSGVSDPGGGTGSSAPGAGFTPPPSSSAAAVAVAAAESRVGDPYVWGASGPNSFDCSGLVMWAYEQAGIQLPHFSGAQYADTVHIPMSDLQPGDLVFFSNPDIHVAMYVGNGMIVQAPYTGAYVEIVPMFSGFTLASRVE
ncbi:MAG: NlpC/P60 family protein [Actinomycetota bacterium]|nr:NlpC/P60 family protein [Actinomycetota bacterium]